MISTYDNMLLQRLIMFKFRFLNISNMFKFYAETHPKTLTWE